jgi:hypothetical protein
MTNHFSFRSAWACGLAISLLALAACPAPAHAEKRVAPAIGNNEDKVVPKRQKAALDARPIGNTLEHIGFQADGLLVHGTHPMSYRRAI